jgi:hypothetical protein
VWNLPPSPRLARGERGFPCKRERRALRELELLGIVEKRKLFKNLKVESDLGWFAKRQLSEIW